MAIIGYVSLFLPVKAKGSKRACLKFEPYRKSSHCHCISGSCTLQCQSNTQPSPFKSG